MTKEKRSSSMTHLDSEIQLLRESILEMMFLVKNQLEKCKKALMNFDEDLAREIIMNENRVNSLELTIDRDCENILALQNPVAIDLRFVLAAIKINSDLERLGDHAESIANYILDFGKPIDDEIIKEMRIEEMFTTSGQMISNIFNALITDDTELARRVFVHDKVLNEINSNASKVTAKLIKKQPDSISHFLYLFTIIRKLERVGDLTKNIAEEIIFHIEAKVLKHQKMKSKKDEKSS